MNTPMYALKNAPALQLGWLMNTMTNTIGYGAIGQEGRVIARENRERLMFENMKMTDTIDKFNEVLNAEGAEEANDVFRLMAGLDEQLTLDPLPNDTMGVYKFLFNGLMRTAAAVAYPPSSIETLLNQLKETPDRAKQLKAATSQMLVKEEESLVKQDLIQAGVERRSGQLAAFDTARMNKLAPMVIDAYIAARMVPLEHVWNDFPAWFQYKLLVTLLNSASRFTGSLRASAEAAVTNENSTAAEDHAKMVTVCEALQEMLREIMEKAEAEISLAFQTRRLDSERHSFIDRKAA